MYTIKYQFGGKKQSASFDKLSDARKNGIKHFPNVVLTNKKGVVLPL
jgi:hypothetical protein